MTPPIVAVGPDDHLGEEAKPWLAMFHVKHLIGEQAYGLPPLLHD
jgi:hypothetical protein